MCVTCLNLFLLQYGDVNSAREKRKHFPLTEFRGLFRILSLLLQEYGIKRLLLLLSLNVDSRWTWCSVVDVVIFPYKKKLFHIFFSSKYVDGAREINKPSYDFNGNREKTDYSSFSLIKRL